MMIHARVFILDGSFDSDTVKEAVRRRQPSLLIQSLRAGAAKNAGFLEMIAAQTLEATFTGNLLARKPEIDFLLRVAGTTQISSAIRKVGTTKGKPFLLLVAGRRRIPPRLRSDGWEELKSRELTENELEKVEVAALLNAIRA